MAGGSDGLLVHEERSREEVVVEDFFAFFVMRNGIPSKNDASARRQKQT
jgi:hypothetical protein